MVYSAKVYKICTSVGKWPHENAPTIFGQRQQNAYLFIQSQIR